MVGKTLKSTSGKPCSCPTGKICTACKTKKVVPPQVIVEEPRRLPVPITVAYYKPEQKSLNNITVQYMEKPKNWGVHKKYTYEEQPKRLCQLCRWYKRRRAIKEWDREILKQRRSDEYERRMKQLIEWEEARQRAHSVPPARSQDEWYASKPKRYRSLPPSKRKRFVHKKEKSAAVKPISRSKYVCVNKCKQRDSMSNRCANCFYRACCKLYCYITCVILLIVIVVIIL